MRGAPRANALWIPALAWLAYAGWEWLVLVMSPDANIRVDLLLIWPVVALATLWAWMRTAMAWRGFGDEVPKGMRGTAGVRRPAR